MEPRKIRADLSTIKNRNSEINPPASAQSFNMNLTMKKKVSSIVLARQKLNRSCDSNINPERLIGDEEIVRSTTRTGASDTRTSSAIAPATTTTIRTPIDRLMDSTTLGLKEIADSVLSELKKNPKRKEVVVNVRVMRMCKDKKKKCVKAKVSTLSYKFNVNQKVLQRMIHQSKPIVKRK
ncbi:predicted protein [Chaetoceros tenuissimus]|uniref:Uncharacterized protein n=1 Tax=Chaetoceros tenuissimus TaxID=426638 RepID=A0AAD3CFF1_9STRA|nr:predicted protein [Chaetoceros tenuissimus]